MMTMLSVHKTDSDLFFAIGAWESLVIRLFWVQEIDSSSLSAPTRRIYCVLYGVCSSGGERPVVVRKVVGSKPTIHPRFPEIDVSCYLHSRWSADR